MFARHSYPTRLSSTELLAALQARGGSALILEAPDDLPTGSVSEGMELAHARWVLARKWVAHNYPVTWRTTLYMSIRLQEAEHGHVVHIRFLPTFMGWLQIGILGPLPVLALVFVVLQIWDRVVWPGAVMAIVVGLFMVFGMLVPSLMEATNLKTAIRAAATQGMP